MINFLDIVDYNCEESEMYPILEAIKFAIRVIQIAVPFALIIWGSLDWFKALIAHDEKEMRMKRKPFISRVIAALIIMILPWLVEYFTKIIVGEDEGNNMFLCYVKAKPRVDFSNWPTFDDDDDDDIDDVKKDDEPTKNETKVKPSTTPTTNTKTTAQTIKDFTSAAKSVKEYTKKNDFKWCAKRVDSKGKIINPACKTKKVEDVLTSKNTQKRMSCATLVSVSLYKSGIYSASDINGHNINSARATAIYLINKGWKVVTNKKDLQAGDVMFFYSSSKSPIKVPGMSKEQRPGHVEIYAGNKKTYNTGGNDYLSKIATKDTHSGFIFALRYQGK